MNKTVLMAALPVFSGCITQSEKEEIKAPNVVIIFTDDQGYADLGCYGAEGFETPNLDSLASQGLRLTDFYVASPVSSPSRAALLTGCYPQRVSIPDVLGPKGPGWTANKYMNGLNPNETTIANMLKEQGYATACIGKWHLGHFKEQMPLKQGFDEYMGLPYSNDMWPENKPVYPLLPLYEGEQVIDTIAGNDQALLVKKYTERSIDFIKRNKEKPFFLYLAHSMPHTPIFASEQFKGSSEKGLYGDVIQEIDWSAGAIIKALKAQNIFENTIIIYTSDNGPWAEFGNHAGSAGPLRGSKGTTFEGGMRVPCIISYPNLIKQGREVNDIIVSIDFLPTIAELTNAKLPENKIDGLSFSALFADKDATGLRKEFMYYRSNNIEAIRSGKWKFHLEHAYRSPLPEDDGVRGNNESSTLEISLFDLSSDIGESENLAKQYPELVNEFTQKLMHFDSIMQIEKRPCLKIYE